MQRPTSGGRAPAESSPSGDSSGSERGDSSGSSGGGTAGFRAAVAAAPWRRLLVGFVAALATGVVVALFVRLGGDWSQGLPWERALLLRMDTSLHPQLDWALLTLPWIATNYTLLPFLAVAALWIALGPPRRADIALHLAVVVLGSLLLNLALKHGFDRPRPELWTPRGQHALASYPSGHAIAGISVLLTIGMFFLVERGWRWPLALLGALVVLSLYSRLYLGVHWPTDVIGGAAVGTVWLALSWRAFRPGHPRVDRGA